MHAIETVDLTKRYGNITAVNNLKLKVKNGEIFGYLGHNGSGKTTTIMMLCGLITPTSGTATVAGYDVEKEILEVKKRIGFLPENTAYYDNLTARQNLEFFGEMAGLGKSDRKERSNELLNLVGLKNWKETKVGKFSKGMQQRLGIAQSLISAPEVIFLDEPTSGLDPEGTRDVRELILQLGREGKTIFLSSHMLAEVKQICDRVGVLRQGKLIALDKIENLAKRVSTNEYVNIKIESNKPEELAHKLNRIEGVEKISKNCGGLLITAKKDVREEIFNIASNSRVGLRTLRLIEPSLEDIFMEIYKVE